MKKIKKQNEEFEKSFQYLSKFSVTNFQGILNISEKNRKPVLFFTRSVSSNLKMYSL